MALPAPFSGWLLETGRRLPVQMNDYPRQNPAYRLTPRLLRARIAALDFSPGPSRAVCTLGPRSKNPPCSPGARDGENFALKGNEPAARLNCSVGFFGRTLTYYLVRSGLRHKIRLAAAPPGYRDVSMPGAPGAQPGLRRQGISST